MKKTLLFCTTALFIATSCVDSLDEYNIDPKSATTVPGITLVSNAQRNLARTVASSSVNLNPFRLYVQYWAQTTYFDESIYNINTRAINGGFWTALYRDVLSDLRESRKIISVDPLISAEVRTNQLAIVEVLEVYVWATLVDTFGNIPYSQALDVSNSQPAYEDAATIYNDLITRLNTAIGQLDEVAGAGTFTNGDLYYKGNIGHWKKLANSLKLRMALTIADADGTKAKSLAEQAATGVFESNQDNAQLTFLSTAPNTNPVWEDLVQSGRYDYVGADTFINQLNTLNDPRLDEYFKPVLGSTDFEGGEYGTSNDYESFSAPGEKLENPTMPGVLLSYSQVEFLLAEARERGYAVGGTAATHYNSAVTASIVEWGGSSTQASAYLAQPTVGYTRSAGYKEKIGVQKWIALYNQPVDAWREYRRLDQPSLIAPDGALSALPLRFTYPVIEQNLNKSNYSTAAAAIGGDVVTTKIFWDKF